MRRAACAAALAAAACGQSTAPAPALGGEEARAIAHQHLTTAAGAAIRSARESNRLALRPRDDTARLVWQVELLVEPAAEMAAGRWFYLVDAVSGEVLERYDGLTTAQQASGPGGNPKAPRSWTAALDVAPSGGEFAMETGRLVTIDMRNQEEGGGEVVVGPLDARPGLVPGQLGLLDLGGELLAGVPGDGRRGARVRPGVRGGGGHPSVVGRRRGLLRERPRADVRRRR